MLGSTRMQNPIPKWNKYMFCIRRRRTYKLGSRYSQCHCESMEGHVPPSPYYNLIITYFKPLKFKGFLLFPSKWIDIKEELMFLNKKWLINESNVK